MTTGWDGAGNVVRTTGTFTGGTVWTDTLNSADKTIKASEHDTHDQTLADSIEDCLNRNGENALTANIVAGGFKFTGVGDAAARDQWLAAGQLQDGEVNWVDSGGAVDAITATYTPNVTALVDGMLLYFRATGANITTTPTFKAGTTTAHTITKNGAQALAAGDIPRDSYECIVRYRLSDTSWELLNPLFTVDAASDTVAGKVELATIAETTTGTDATRAVTPAGLHGITSLSGAVWMIDEDTMASNLDTKVPSQQSVKAYVDAKGAAASDQETGTSTTLYVTPGVQHRHPTAVKVWISLGMDATNNASTGVSSTTDTGAADWTVTFTTAFSSAAYGATHGQFWNSQSNNRVALKTQAAGSLHVQAGTGAGLSETDTITAHVACYGDQ